MEASIVIPTLNEEDSVKEVICGLNSLELDLEIIVVDDDSNDQTRARAREVGAKVIKRTAPDDLSRSILMGVKSAKDGNRIKARKSSPEVFISSEASSSRNSLLSHHLNQF